VERQPRAGLKVVLAVEIIEVPTSPQLSAHAAMAARERTKDDGVPHELELAVVGLEEGPEVLLHVVPILDLFLTHLCGVYRTDTRRA
jgi:hypothetical protein